MVAQRISKLSVGAFDTWTKAEKAEAAFVLFDIIHEIAHCIATVATLDSSSPTWRLLTLPIMASRHLCGKSTPAVSKASVGISSGPRWAA
jgi:hypothetical protein